MPRTPRNNASFPSNNQQGTYLIFSAIVLMVMFGFAALGVEVGRWYAIQGELGKSIDGAAFAGAKNVNNPNIDLNTFVRDVAEANFPDGLLGTDFPTFDISTDGRGRVMVDGETHSLNTLAKAVDPGYAKTRVVADGAAKLRRAEIALVLDVSGSMAGNALTNLKDGAKLFVENFDDQEDQTKMALLAFASGVDELHDLDFGFTSQMTTDINGLTAQGMTNAEHSLRKAGDLPWEDQSGLSMNEQAIQAVIFFSDGNPNTFHSTYKRDNNTYKASNFASGKRLFDSDYQNQIFSPNFDPTINGDGLPIGTSACKNSKEPTVKWEIFEDPNYGFSSGIYPPLDGTNPESCTKLDSSDLFRYGQRVARQMAIDNAAALKLRGILVYTIGLGSVDRIFLAELSSGSKYQFYTSDPKELEGIFQKIANILKLVLVH